MKNESTKYFFDKTFELLHRKTFDTYRVSLHNPFTIFDELDKAIIKFNKKRIKHFDPTVTSIGIEAKGFLDNSFIDDVFHFNPFSKKHLIDVLESKCIKNQKGSTEEV